MGICSPVWCIGSWILKDLFCLHHLLAVRTGSLSKPEIGDKRLLKATFNMVSATQESWRAHWKCFVACGIIVLCPFQYGVDFGLIGGLQAMKGFLMVGDPLILI